MEKGLQGKIYNDTTASYFSTMCGFDFSIDEFRVFLTLLRDLSDVFSNLDLSHRIEESVNGRQLTVRQRRKEVVSILRQSIAEHGEDDRFTFTANEDGSLHVSAYINHFLPKGSKNYSRVKQAFSNLNDKYIEVEDHKGNWAKVRLFEMPSILSYDHANFTVNPYLVEYFIDLSRGYRRFNFDVAFNFKSVYTSRIYILLSGQTGKMPPVSLIKLRRIFGLGDRYKDDRDFIKWVIKASQKEMTLKAPFTFDYKIIRNGADKQLKFSVKRNAAVHCPGAN